MRSFITTKPVIFSTYIDRHRLRLKARERTAEHDALRTNSDLQLEVGKLRSKIVELQERLSTTENQHSQHFKVSQ